MLALSLSPQMEMSSTVPGRGQDKSGPFSQFTNAVHVGTVGSGTTAGSAVSGVDNELTSLNWLQETGVLNSMCSALTGSPHRLSARSGSKASGPAGSSKKPRGYNNGKNVLPGPGEADGEESSGSSSSSSNNADKMVNVILNVRNRKYNGTAVEDSHKPPLSFACMIFMAIESYPSKTLPVKDIYEWIMWRFPYYRSAAPGWKNSVRHNLSLNKCFKRVDRNSSKVSVS